MTPVPVEERRLDRNYIYEASAGTGKTTTLVARVVEVLAAGRSVDEIVAVTFTHAAAGEMKLRVRQKLGEAREKAVDPAVRANLSHALQHLDRAFIGTIHAFCAVLLRSYPVEAEVDPRFEELAQPEALSLFGDVFQSWIEQKLSENSPVLRRALLRCTWSEESDRDPLLSLKSAAWKLVEWRDHPAAWEHRPYDRSHALEGLLAEIDALDKSKHELQPLAEFASRTKLALELKIGDDDSLESEILRLPQEMRWVKSEPAWEELKRSIQVFRQESGADLAAKLRDELWELTGLYDAAKRRRGQIDFMDLLLKARELLRKSGPQAQLQQRYRCIFIDEFQDTDPLQAEILLSLALPGDGTLFVVGDPKQSIYRFRRADAKFYRAVSNELEAGGAIGKKLTRSQRSVRPIQEFVNAAFPEQPLEAGREPTVGQPCIVALPIPKPWGWRGIEVKAINASSPGATAAFVDWLIRLSGWTVEDRPVQARDICLLFRRFTNNQVDLTQEYVRALEARGIAHVLVGSKSFHQREEIGTIRAALRAIEWPDDELSVFAMLHGSLFAIPDNALLKYKHRFGSFHPFRTLPDDLDPEFWPIRDVLQLLVQLHRKRNSIPVADSIQQLLEAARAHAGFAFRKGGKRVVANVYRLCDLAREFERNVSTSFRSFVEYLDAEEDLGEMAEAPVLEQQADGVKLMTVHKAKGLEFPVVILADLTAKLSSASGPDRYVDLEKKLCAQSLFSGCSPWELLDHAAEEAEADREEAYRLAYVAATRARDLLVVCAVGEQRFENSWLSPLYDALYPSRDRWRISELAPGCPQKNGEGTVLNHPPDYGFDDGSIRPGLHRPVAGTHEVVWFDPRWLPDPPQTNEGVANEERLQGSAEPGLSEYKAWQESRVRILEKGTQPSFKMATATSAPRVLGREPELVVASDITRKSNRSLGRLVHSVLQHAEDLASAEALCPVYARLHDLRQQDLPSALAAVRAGMLHPLVRPGHREFPVLAKLEDGTMVEGKVDLAYFDGTMWTVIDYKTGSADEERYRNQLRLYAYALEQATQQPVRAVLLQI